MKALNKKRHMLLEHPIFIASHNISRRAVVSHKAKKKQHVWASLGLCDHYSELFTWMAALKLQNAVLQLLLQLLLQLSLSYYTSD